MLCVGGGLDYVDVEFVEVVDGVEYLFVVFDCVDVFWGVGED